MIAESWLEMLPRTYWRRVLANMLRAADAADPPPGRTHATTVRLCDSGSPEAPDYVLSTAADHILHSGANHFPAPPAGQKPLPSQLLDRSFTISDVKSLIRARRNTPEATG